MATLLRDFDDGLDAAVAEFVTDAFAAISPSAVNVAAAAMTILVVIHGVRMMFGQSQTPLQDQFWLILRYGIVAAFLINFSAYELFVVDLVQALPRSFGGALFDAEASEAALDGYWSAGMQAAAAIYDDAGMRSFENYVFGAMVQLATVITTGIAFVIASIAKVGAALFLAFGPVAILSVLFQATRGIFEGWLRGLITFTLTQIFVMLAIGLLLSVFSGFLDGLEAKMIDEQSRPTSLGIFLLVAAITGLVTAQVPNFAVSVGGGVTASTLGYGAALVARGQRIAGGALSGTARGMRTGIAHKDNAPIRYRDAQGNLQYRSPRFNEGWRAGAITRAARRMAGRGDQLAADDGNMSRTPGQNAGAAAKVMRMDSRARSTAQGSTTAAAGTQGASSPPGAPGSATAQGPAEKIARMDQRARSKGDAPKPDDDAEPPPPVHA